MMERVREWVRKGRRRKRKRVCGVVVCMVGFFLGGCSYCWGGFFFLLEVGTEMVGMGLVFFWWIMGGEFVVWLAFPFDRL